MSQVYRDLVIAEEERCEECPDGVMSRVAIPDRWITYARLHMEVPADLELNTCSVCGTMELSPTELRLIDARLKPSYEAIKQLQAAGLCAFISSTEPLLIVGGQRETNEGDIRLFLGNPFCISERADGWLTVVQTVGQQAYERLAGSLLESVTWVVDEKAR